MPITITYDLKDVTSNQRTYIRSMFERFGWRRLGGSVFRYDGQNNKDDTTGEEDWFNQVVPAIMFMRAYCLRYEITIRYMTIDAHSVAHIDYSDEDMPLGCQPVTGNKLPMEKPTNEQSSMQTIQNAIDAMTNAIT